MPDPSAPGNSFAALAEAYGSSDGESAVASPRVKLEETEATVPLAGLDATTRVEVDLTASEGSPPAHDVTLTPPHGGGVRAREDTPSASLAFQERQAKINAANNDRRRGEALGSASNMVGSTKQVTSLPFRRAAAPTGEPTRPHPVGEAEILVPETQQPTAPALSGGSAQHNARQSGAPRAAAPPAPGAALPAAGATAARKPQAGGTARTFMRTEPEANFARRTGAAANQRIKQAAPTSPSPAPSTARSQAASGAASPGHREGPPAPPFQDAGAEDVDMYDDAAFPVAPAAQPRARDSSSPDAPEPFEPRGDNLIGEHRRPTDKELAAMVTIAPELALATMPFKAYGPMTPIDGATEDAHLFGVGEKQIAYFDSKPGPKVVCHVRAVFNKLATSYTIDEILEMLENLSDRIFVAFPGNRLMWAHLWSPNNAPSGRRVRMNMFVAWNMTPLQQAIWNAGRFLNAGDTELISYYWREAASDYKYSFAFFRSKIVDVALLAVREAMYESDDLKACVTRQAQEDGIDPVDLMETICARIRLGQIMVARPKSTKPKPQYDVRLKVNDLFSEDELAKFTTAFRALEIQHEEHGKAGIVRWACRFCLAISHPVGKCGGSELAGWKEQPAAPAPAPAPVVAPNFNKPRRDAHYQPPAQPFNGGRRGPGAGFA